MSAITKLGIDPDDFIFQPNAHSEAQKQTQQAFGYMWSRRTGYESPEVQQRAQDWLIERYCSGQPDRVKEWLNGGGKLILDAGCGSGFSAILLFGDLLNENDYLGVDLSEAMEVAKLRFAERELKGDFLRASITDLPLPDEAFDMIFSEGVLHHTDSTQKAMLHLSSKLKPGGRFLFYVYSKKSVIREFTDDYIRHHLSGLNDEETWNALIPLTKLGMQLGKLSAHVEILEDIPFLGIEKGRMDLQRFFFYHICKAYYRPELSVEEMNHFNFDWFRPLNCHRHTEPEIRDYCREANLEIEHLDLQPSGITVVATKR